MKISRRYFLGASSALALVIGAPDIAKAGWAHGSYRGPFTGNPNAAISAINTSGGIVMSRTSGDCVPASGTPGTSGYTPGSPAFVHVSASGISCTGTVTAPSAASINASAYSDLEYSWDFGDPSGTEVFTNPATGATVNANTGQTGPEAAYAYRTLGTKTIKLSIRGKTSGGGYVTATVTSTFTVNDFTAQAGYKAWYIDGVNGNDAWDGTAPQFVSGTTGPKATLLKTNGSNHGIAYVVTNTSCVFVANGSALTDQGNIWMPTTNGALALIDTSVRYTSYIGATVSATHPSVATTVVSSNNTPLIINNNSASLGNGTTVTDIVISNINFQTSGTSAQAACSCVGAVNDPFGCMYDIYLDTCNFTIGTTGAAGNNFEGVACGLNTPFAGDTQRIGIWGCNFYNPVVGALNPSWGVVLGLQASQWTFFVGGNVVGDGAGGGLSHSIYSHAGNHLLYRWFSNKPASTDTTYGQDYALNTEAYPFPSNRNAANTIGVTFGATVPAGGSGAGLGAQMNIGNLGSSFIAGSIPLSVGMIVHDAAGLFAKITADVPTSISSFTYSGGVGTITASHYVRGAGYSIPIVVTGATPSGYNGTYIAKYASSTTLTVTMADPGAASASVPGSYTGGSYTITPNSLTTVPVISSVTAFIGANANAAFTGSYSTGTPNTITVNAGSIVGTINTGDAITGLNAGPPESWSPIGTLTGSPPTSFAILPPDSSFVIGNQTNVTYYTFPISLPCVISYTLISDCLLATTQGGHSGNSSTNNGSYLKYDDYVCQNSAFVNLQTYGVSASCLDSYTMRYCRFFGTTNQPANGAFYCSMGGGTASLTSTVSWRLYGNKAYNVPWFDQCVNSAVPAADQPTSTLPLQFTDNQIWGPSASDLGMQIYASYYANAIIDRNYYNFPATSGPGTNFMNSGTTTLPFSGAGSWQALGINFDPHSTNVNSSTPSTGPMASWTIPPTKWSDLGA